MKTLELDFVLMQLLTEHHLSSFIHRILLCWSTSKDGGGLLKMSSSLSVFHNQQSIAENKIL